MMPPFAGTENFILKFIWSLKGSQRAQMILKKEEQSWGPVLPDLKTYYKEAAIKLVWY